MGNCCRFMFRKYSSIDCSSLLDDDYDFDIHPIICKYSQMKTPKKISKMPSKLLTRKDTLTLYSEGTENKKININDFIPFKILGKGSFGKVLLVEQKSKGFLNF